MFNIGGGELLVILVIALIVLGPEKLPDAVRRAGRIYGELRRMSSGFQAELRDAIDEPIKEIRSTTDLVKSTFAGGQRRRRAPPRQRRRAGLDDDPDDGSVDDLGDADVMARVEGDRPEALPCGRGSGRHRSALAERRRAAGATRARRPRPTSRSRHPHGPPEGEAPPGARQSTARASPLIS